MAFNPKLLNPEQQADYAALKRNTGGNFQNFDLNKRYGQPAVPAGGAVSHGPGSGAPPTVPVPRVATPPGPKLMPPARPVSAPPFMPPAGARPVGVPGPGNLPRGRVSIIEPIGPQGKRPIFPPDPGINPIGPPKGPLPPVFGGGGGFKGGPGGRPIQSTIDPNDPMLYELLKRQFGGF